jgi:cell division protein ZapE
MKPSEKYDEFMRQSGYLIDASQRHSLYLLDSLYEKLSKNGNAADSFLQKIRLKIFKNKNQHPGLYLWGGVGRGKTFLMDLFFEVLPLHNKKRYHFHHFMQKIHAEIAHAEKGADPIREIGEKLSEQIEVLCLDEFVINDIADAMLIGRLLETLFEQGVTLVTTSNSPPEQLYKDGLQRENFLPAIDLLTQHCQVCNLDGGQDYRRLGLKQTELYKVPNDESALLALHHYVEKHVLNRHEKNMLTINGRGIKTEMYAEDLVWFNFTELCKTKRSRFDYLEIAREFSIVIVSGIEAMNDGADDVARRFVSLIDVLYDHRVKLICTAEVAVHELYQQQFLAFEFQRTVSRLLEMQSSDYVGQSHIA